MRASLGLGGGLLQPRKMKSPSMSLGSSEVYQKSCRRPERRLPLSGGVLLVKPELPRSLAAAPRCFLARQVADPEASRIDHQAPPVDQDLGPAGCGRPSAPYRLFGTSPSSYPRYPNGGSTKRVAKPGQVAFQIEAQVNPHVTKNVAIGHKYSRLEHDSAPNATSLAGPRAPGRRQAPTRAGRQTRRQSDVHSRGRRPRIQSAGRSVQPPRSGACRRARTGRCH